MGQVAVVHSDVKNSGKSVFTYIAANLINKMISKDKKVLVCCLNSGFSILYKLFGIDVSDLGMEELINYQRLGSCRESEVISGIIPRSSGIYFLGSFRNTDSYTLKSTEKYAELIKQLKNTFDLIIFDTVSSINNTLTNMAIKEANIVLELFVQDVESMKNLWRIKEKEALNTHETIFVVSKYRDIYPKVSDIKRMYSIKNIFTVDYCKTLQEMKNRDSLHHYIQRDTSCNKSIRHISEYVLDSLGLSADSSREERRFNRKGDLLNNLFKVRRNKR